MAHETVYASGARLYVVMNTQLERARTLHGLAESLSRAATTPYWFAEAQGARAAVIKGRVPAVHGRVDALHERAEVLPKVVQTASENAETGYSLAKMIRSASQLPSEGSDA